ncbi:MAG: cytochrome c [Gammaproteobacteria bacterium]|nr:cytochrome c [Gammaproteobacteria bacterium]
MYIKPDWRRRVITAGALLMIFTIVLLRLSTASADKRIVEGVKALPVMQQAAGQTLFKENCASCHGALADGVDGVGPPLIHPYYKPDHHADIAFYRAASQGVRAHHWPFGDMPAQPQIGRDEMQKVIAYLRDLQRLNGIE